jgi:SAM-dependent methyltransferase
MTAVTSGTTPGSYTLDNGWDEARRRLRLLEQCYDPGTIRQLRALGVMPGWRCLELGAGGGSITQFLCREVGPDGRVTAVDIDTRFLDEVNAANLDVLRLDVSADKLPARRSTSSIAGPCSCTSRPATACSTPWWRPSGRAAGY